jgi:cell division protein FtsB
LSQGYQPKPTPKNATVQPTLDQWTQAAIKELHAEVAKLKRQVENLKHRR